MSGEDNQKELTMRKKISMALILAVGISASACYGPFELTKKVYNWNGSLGDKWVVEGAFLVMNIIPVYGAAGFVDAVVLNSVKFWTGKSALSSQVIEKDGMKAVMTGYSAQKVVRMDIYRDGKFVETAVLKPSTDGTMQAVMLDGSRMVSRQATDGSFVVARGDGKVLGKYSASEAESIIR